MEGWNENAVMGQTKRSELYYINRDSCKKTSHVGTIISKALIKRVQTSK